MARRFVYFQGSPALPEFPLKLLLEKYDGDAQGYYVGGWGEPVFVAANPGTFDNRLLLYGITATGPGPNDWLVGGWRRQPGNVFSFVFYDHTGLIFEDIKEHRFWAVGGHFSSSLEFASTSAQNRRWATSAGGAGQATISGSSAALTYGFVLPNVSTGTRLNDLLRSGLTRNYVVPNLDLSYALFVGNESGDTGTYPNGNPWLASAAGTFTRLSTDLNAAIPRSDLIGLTLYDKGVDAYAESVWWPAAGQHSLTVTPWTIAAGGACTEGTAFPVQYIAPDPAQYFAWDASLWVEPSTLP